MPMLSYTTMNVRPLARRVRWGALVIGALAAGCTTLPPAPPAVPPATGALPPPSAPAIAAPPAPAAPAGPATSRAIDRVPMPAAPLATPAPPTIPAPAAALHSTPGPAVAPAPVQAPRPSLQAIAPGTLYVCFTEANGQAQETPIELGPKVGALCRRHPEMGPCQYEREMCRQSGGRVFTAAGLEITPATEAEYDKRVLRVRFRAN